MPAGPVLLVDDLVVSGWTLTVAGVALREAGATAVLPRWTQTYGAQTSYAATHGPRVYVRDPHSETVRCG